MNFKVLVSLGRVMLKSCGMTEMKFFMFSTFFLLFNTRGLRVIQNNNILYQIFGAVLSWNSTLFFIGKISIVRFNNIDSTVYSNHENDFISRTLTATYTLFFI